MWLNASNDYAIRMLICLSRASGAVSSSKLSRAIGVSPRYLLQIGARLRDAGFVHVGHGSAGGYQCIEKAMCLFCRIKDDRRRIFTYWNVHIDNWKKGYKGSWRALRFQICHRQSVRN